MNEPPCDIFQKYLAKGRVGIIVEAPPHCVPTITRQLGSPGMMTLVPRLNHKKLIAALVDEGISQKDAQTIARSTKIVDDTYLVPEEYDSPS